MKKEYKELEMETISFEVRDVFTMECPTYKPDPEECPSYKDIIVVSGD